MAELAPKQHFFLGEPLRRALRALLASGYPLHHLRAPAGRYGGSATIPLASRTVAPEVRLGATALLCSAFFL